MDPRIDARDLTACSLTQREEEVLTQVAHGLSNPQIAAALFVSRRTVATHLEHIYDKLGASTRTQAVLMALRCGLTVDAH